MDPHEEKELEESLDFMRKQFRALTDDIKIPDSLRADLLKKQLELMEAEQEEEEERKRRKKRRSRSGARRRDNVIPLRAFVGMSACFVVVGVSLLSFQLGKSAGSLATPSGAPETAMMAAPDIPEEAAMPEAAAAPDEDGGIPAAGGSGSFPDDLAAAPAALYEAAPEDAPYGAPVPELSGAPVPDSAAVAPRSAVLPESEETGLIQADSSPAAWEAYLPETLPEGMALANSAENGDSFSASYLNEDYSRQIQVTLRPQTAADEANLVDPSARDTYDLRLYTLPYSESVPAELADLVNDPIFRQGDLSLSLVEARIFDPNGGAQARGNFSVLLSSGVVAEFNVTGVSAQEVFAMISQMVQ